MKKIISLIAAISIITAASTTVSAHGHNRTAAVKYSVCVVESCGITGLHSHDNLMYTAHYYGDGHQYHDYCSTSDCTLTGYHEHDGAYCFPHTESGGHGRYRTGGSHH